MRTPLLVSALALALGASIGPAASPAGAIDIGVIGKKLIISDTTALNGKSKLSFQAKDTAVQKGTAGSPNLLSGSLRVFYTDNAANSSSLPMPSQGWTSNLATVAKFLNRVAPAAPSEIKSGVIKPGKTASINAKAKGAINISAPPGPGGLTVVLTINNQNGGSHHRMCTRFSVADGSSVQHKLIGGGVSRKLTLKNGVPAACPADCADGFKNGDETDVDCGGSLCGTCDDGDNCVGNGDCDSGVCTGNVCQAPTCSDGVENQDETDVDCGGSCGPCDDGEDCENPNDCDSGVCTGNVCQAPTCSDGVENQDETDVDCGGNTCGDCDDGDGCNDGDDCASGVCTGNICQSPACGDGVQNQDETDVDCGGSCAACDDGDGCADAGDCLSGVCTGNICQVPTCGDGVENQDETDTDCGGSCGPCPNGAGCGDGLDCQSLVCTGGICQVPTCTDSHQNQNETDVDCGGSCPDCGPGDTCNIGNDCTSGICSSGICTTPNCFDGVKNQNESAIDCGGVCGDCGPGHTCNTGADCTSSICSGGLCTSPSCSDGVKNQNETDTDCGGVCPDCALGRTCGGGGDCVSGVCSSGVCRCGNQVRTFSITSSTGGPFTGATWPDGSQSHSFSPECSVTILNPSGRIDLVGLLGDRFEVSSFSGFSNCFGSGGEDGDGCAPNSCPFAGIGFCEATRPSCSVALNGSGSATYRVQCNQ